MKLWHFYLVIMLKYLIIIIITRLSYYNVKTRLIDLVWVDFLLFCSIWISLVQITVFGSEVFFLNKTLNRNIFWAKKFRLEILLGRNKFSSELFFDRKNDVDAVARMECFRALKLTLVESFRALKFSTLFEYFRTLKVSILESFMALKLFLLEDFRVLKIKTPIWEF